MKTREFFRRNAYLYLYTAAFFLAVSGFVRGTADAVSSSQALSGRPIFVIDPGHGGIDGGTTSCSGVLERDINLQIAQRLEKVLALLGCDTIMTRTTAESVATEGETIRQQKQSDLRNRAEMICGTPGAVLVSIHQNHYPDSRYAGPQVFYAPTAHSRELAQYIQSDMNQGLDSKRNIKAADGVYLMQHIDCPGVLIECGFLSNPAEDAALQTKAYQNKLCCIIAAALANWAAVY